MLERDRRDPTQFAADRIDDGTDGFEHGDAENRFDVLRTARRSHARVLR
jgi:hypothetical protein